MPTFTFAGMKYQEFTSSGTWFCPANVTNVIVHGCGGGGGGGGGNGTEGGDGGNGALPIAVFATVVPGTTYNIVIGGGGPGGAATSRGGIGSTSSMDGIGEFPGGPGGRAYPGAVYAAEQYGIKGGQVVGGFGAESIGYDCIGLGGDAGAEVGGVYGGGGGGASFGNGGAGGTNTVGSSGGVGAGGGGGAGGYAGGNGGAGKLVIYWVESKG